MRNSTNVLLVATVMIAQVFAGYETHAKCSGPQCVPRSPEWIRNDREPAKSRVLKSDKLPPKLQKTGYHLVHSFDTAADVRLVYGNPALFTEPAVLILKRNAANLYEYYDSFPLADCTDQKLLFNFSNQDDTLDTTAVKCKIQIKDAGGNNHFSTGSESDSVWVTAQAGHTTLHTGEGNANIIIEKDSNASETPSADITTEGKEGSMITCENISCEISAGDGDDTITQKGDHDIKSTIYAGDGYDKVVCYNDQPQEYWPKCLVHLGLGGGTCDLCANATIYK